MPCHPLGIAQRTKVSVPRGIISAMSDPTSIRLVEWNVNMALHTKAHVLASLRPTLAVLPESAHPDRCGAALKAVGATSLQWTGGNATKGLLVAAFGDWELHIDESFDPGYQWVLPLHVTGPRRLRLLAVWDMNHRGSGHDSARKLGSCRASMERYSDFLAGESDLTVISGDFNNSVYWDKPSSNTKFGDFMDQLESRGFVSAYHHHMRCARGAEPDASLWWMKNVNKTYHVDYTFVDHADAIASVTMGAAADWLALSDHSPMTVDLTISSDINGRSAATSTSAQ